MGLLLATVDLVSELPPAEVLAALETAVGGHAGAPFAGATGRGEFRIVRANEYRTTFLPVARGTVSAAGKGSAVRLRIRPHGSVLLFLAIWTAFLAVVAALAVAWRLRSPANSPLWIAGPLLLAAVTWRIASGVFAAEARWLVRHLTEKVPTLRGAGGGRG